MRVILKWAAIALGGLAILAVSAAAGLYLYTSWRLNRAYAVVPETIPIRSDAATLARGRRLTALYCSECHALDLAGDTVYQGPGIARINGPNLTAGQGGVGGAYSDADWVRAIRHGVRPDGRAMLIMPSADYYYLSDQDLAAIIAYVKSVPPVDRVWAAPALEPLGGILIGAGAFGPVLHAETIDHGPTRPAAVEAGVTVAYGEYLAKPGGCVACHGPDLAGAASPNPDAPPAPNLTTGGHLAEWSEAEFITALRTGRTPDGHGLEPEFMPWPSTANYTDEELKAIWAYIRWLPAAESRVPEDDA